MSLVPDSAPLSCKVCGLCAMGARSWGICGEGPRAADLMVIGEYPGWHEDSAGRPWMGRAGQFIRDALARSGVDPDRVFYTNLLRCKPPAGFVLKPQHWGACGTFLRQELEWVKPTAILLCGEQAAAAYLGIRTIRNARRAPHLKDGRYVVCTYNPAAGLRDLGIAMQIMRDLHMAARAARGELVRQQHGDYREIRTAVEADRVFQELERAPVVACDLETSPLHPWMASQRHPRKILCAQFSAAPGSSYTVPWAHRGANLDPAEQAGIWRAMVRFWESNTRKIWQNGLFDCTWLLSFGVEPGGFFADTMIASHLLDELAPGHGLDVLVWYYTDLGDYWSGLESRFGALKAAARESGEEPPTYDDLEWSDLAPYSMIDPDATLRVWLAQEPRLREEGLLDVLTNVYSPASVTFARAKLNGVVYDPDRLHEIRRRITDALTEQLSKLRALPTVRRYEAELAARHVKPDEAGFRFNPQSNTQIADFLYGFLGLPRSCHGTDDSDTVDADALAPLVSRCTAVKYLLPLRKLTKYLSTYVEAGAARRYSGWLPSSCTGPDAASTVREGIIHTEFQITGTKTGRISSRDPNLLNIPRDEEDDDKLAWLREYGVARIKTLWVSRFVGGQIVEGDLSQAEVRVFSQYSGDPALQAVLAQEGDVHTLSAAQLFHCTPDRVTKQQRQGTKSVVFLTLYGGGEERLAATIGCTIEEGRAFQKRYFDTFPGARAWMHAQERLAYDTGVVTTMTGQRRRLYAALGQHGRGSADPKVASALRRAINSPVQGTATHLCLMAMNMLDALFQKYKLKSVLILHVYDSIVSDTHPKETEAVCELTHKVMTSLRLPWLTVPLRADVKCGPSWGETTKWRKHA